MARQPTGRKKGRPFVYESDDERPVTVSLRIPHNLAERARRSAALQRQSVTALLLDGLRWRIGEGDPHAVGTALPQPVPPGAKSDGNPDPSCGLLTDTTRMALLEEIRTALACQATQLYEIAQAILPRCSVVDDNQYLSNTVIEHEQTAHGAARQPETAEQQSDDTQQTHNVPADVPDYDPTRFQLGALCKRGHAHGDTGQSLRELRGGKVADCSECHKERARTSQARRLAKQGVGQ